MVGPTSTSPVHTLSWWGTNASSTTIWEQGPTRIVVVSRWVSDSWGGAWLDRLVRAGRRARRARHLEALRSLPKRRDPGVVEAPSKVARWLTLVCRTRG